MRLTRQHTASASSWTMPLYPVCKTSRGICNPRRNKFYFCLSYSWGLSICANVGLKQSFCFFVCLFFLPLADDLRLNSRVFQWPNQILTELEDSKTRLATMREKAEGYLRTRLLNEHLKHSVCHLFVPPQLHPSTAQLSHMRMFCSKKCS